MAKKSEITYLNKELEVVPKNQATMAIIRVFDGKKLVEEIWGELEVSARKMAEDIRGEPLPVRRSESGWQVIEADIDKAQRWVDKALEEAGLE